MQRLLIIDGNAIVHRAFHAFPPLNRPDGQQVNAVYGFLSILIKALEEVKPEYLLICFDRPKPTFRKLLYAGYQAHRPKMADGLSDQMKILQEALEMIGIPLFGVDGYEADDVIGTLAVQAAGINTNTTNVKYQISNKGNKKKEDLEFDIGNLKLDIIILSGDRDLLQLVNSHVKMLAPVVGITKFILYDEATVLEKYGVKPSQVADYKALVGDASDGYPGVTGIGPKTAYGLLKKYETVENLYLHIGELPEKVALKLATDAEQAALAKKLARIALDVPVTLDIAVCAMTLFTKEKVEMVCDMYGFHSLKKRLQIFTGHAVSEPVEVSKNIEKPAVDQKKKKEKNEAQLELI